MLEAIDTHGEADPDLLHPVRMSDDRLPVPMRRLDHGTHLVSRHLILVDELDEIDAGIHQLLHLAAGVLGPAYPPAQVTLVGLVWRVLDEGP